MAINLIETQPRRSGLLPTEKVTLLYTLFTTLVLLVLWNRFSHPLELLEGRALVLGGLCLTGGLYCLVPSRLTLFFRQLYPLTLLGFWYPDTYEFCQLFPYLDHVFAHADQWLFGCQPALAFSELLPGKLWSELFHLGYFSYYPLIAITVLAPLFVCREQFGRTAFIVMSCFFLYYLIYLFLPVAGPQYYFPAAGLENIRQGIFPAMGDWFRTHAELQPGSGPDGFFRSLVDLSQASGERPTAAFPSSHVGISTVLMFLLYRNCRKLLWPALPFYVFLCGATVYIEAHYLVDVFGGLITAVAFYRLSDRAYPYFAARSPEDSRMDTERMSVGMVACKTKTNILKP